jgi:hypothetical protein
LDRGFNFIEDWQNQGDERIILGQCYPRSTSIEGLRGDAGKMIK